MRIFLAVAGDPEWIESARRLTRDLQPRLPKASWTRPESWHLTVRFLGEIPESAVSRFTERLASAASAWTGGELPSAGPALFPSPDRPRAIGVAFERGAAESFLGVIARTAEAAARDIGCEPENRPFRPHVTFARLRATWPRGAVEEAAEAIERWRFPAWRLAALVLYRSRLDPAGAVHDPLQEWRAAAEIRA